MLSIRKEQYEELGKVTFRQFEEEMAEHLKKYFPKYCEIYGEPLIRKVIRSGAERAEVYGFITKRDTPLFIDLMLLLGSHFDEDPQYPWAADILNSKSLQNPMDKADTLYDKAVEFLDKAAGKENEYLGRALLRLRDIPLDRFAPQPVPNPKQRTAAFLQEIWPQKYNVLGGALINRLLDGGIQLAREHRMPSEQAVAVITTLKFLLGGGFHQDLQFPWVAAILKEDTIPNPAAKTDQLYKAAISCLNKWLS